ncbi:MAG: hypothetical protein M3Z01_08780, partial [Thermoproteota archaeon]|nr:hypothetical protein [Thermoproteota archaeon]
IVLFPLYVFIFHLIFSARRKRIQDPILKKYHKQFFWAKIITTIAFTVFCLFISPGDSTSFYYPEGLNIFHLILKDPANIKWIFMQGKNFDETLLYDIYNMGYFRGESNYFIVRLVSILSFISFGRYVILNLFFSMIAYTGVWRLYKFFYEQYPHLHKALAIAVLFLPTLIFWTSGILKDPICMAVLGWLTYSLYHLFYKKKGLLKNIIIIIISGYSLFIVKAYILFSYLPFFILFIILRNLKDIKNIVFKLATAILVLVFSILIFFLIADRLQDEMGLYAVDNLAETVKTQQENYINMADLAESSFSLGVEFDGSSGSLIKMAPAAIVATFYRPFIWESKKISTLLSSFESLAMMFLLIYVFVKVGPLNFAAGFFKDPMILFSFFFSVVFALFVGATTLNFGTLVRYKIPCLPFYIVALVLILDIYNKKKALHPLKKKTVAVFVAVQ